MKLRDVIAANDALRVTELQLRVMIAIFRARTVLVSG